MNTVFIYALKCPTTGDVRYVGKAKNPTKRFSGHLRDARQCHRTSWIQSLVAVGQKPVLEILDEVEEVFWPQWEVAWIAFYRELDANLVNATPGGDAGPDNTGNKHSLDTITKMSFAATGRKSSPETCAKVSAARVGTRASEETRAKLKALTTGAKNPFFGKSHSEEVIAKMRARNGEKSPNFGKHPSAETCAKRSVALIGENNPMFGKKHSEESRTKMSAARTGKHHSVETRAKISEANRRRAGMKFKKKSSLTLNQQTDIDTL